MPLKTISRISEKDEEMRKNLNQLRKPFVRKLILMQFNINRDLLLKSLNFVQGVVEKKNTFPILSNVLINIKNNKLEIVATDLDIIFYDEISELKVVEEGNTTTSANVLLIF